MCESLCWLLGVITGSLGFLFLGEFRLLLGHRGLLFWGLCLLVGLLGVLLAELCLLLGPRGLLLVEFNVLLRTFALSRIIVECWFVNELRL